MYVKLTNGQPSAFPYSPDQVRRDNPGTSFPKTIPDATLALYEVYPVVKVQPPAVDLNTHTLSQWVELVGATWTQTWVVEPLPEAQAATNIRTERRRRLDETDWTQLGDSPVQPVNEWRTYRQALRDITTQSGFPHNVTWPTEPTT